MAKASKPTIKIEAYDHVKVAIGRKDQVITIQMTFSDDTQAEIAFADLCEASSGKGFRLNWDVK